MEPETRIREMRREDLAGVMRVDAACLPVPWSEAVWRSEMASPLGLHLVAATDGGIVAQIGAKKILDELHVTTVCVMPERRRTGLATALLREAVVRFVEVASVTLEVRSKNTGAREFYRRLGFAEEGIRPGYYCGDDAVVMTLQDLRGLRESG